ncbi:MAG: Ig-like domain-containing protein [Bacteroidales bacterium]|nr:Ig-like domain-containing protein [Bacteroidales bacterium]
MKMRLFRNISYLLVLILTLSFISCSNEDEMTDIESISFKNIKRGRLTLTIGESFKVRYTILPSEFQNSKVVWETSDSKVATVKNGNINAIGEGTTNISAYAGEASATFRLTVEPIDIESFEFAYSQVTVNIGEATPIDIRNILPEDGSISTIEWTIEDDEIACYDIIDGVLHITAIKEGTTTLTGESDNCKKSCIIVAKKLIPLTAITLSLDGPLYCYDTQYIRIKRTPADAYIDYDNISWSFSPEGFVKFRNEEVLLIEGLKCGEATITATTSSGIKNSLKVTVLNPHESSGKNNGHDYVDLGLPSGTKWACYNVGATKLEGIGSLFAWGETDTKSTYTWSNYKWGTGKYDVPKKYNSEDNLTTLELADDAARANMGGTWRMPTKAELGELFLNCIVRDLTINGVKGLNFVSRINGKAIFIPYIEGTLSMFWTSSLNNASRKSYSFVLYDGSDSYTDERAEGLPVRAVCK